MVSIWEDRVPGTYKTPGEPADRSVSGYLWHSQCRRCGHDRRGSLSQTEGQIGKLSPVPSLTVQWEERRVFYCTPQTLDNDLKRGAVDPRDIVLAVFGSYRTVPTDFQMKRIRHLDHMRTPPSWHTLQPIILTFESSLSLLHRGVMFRRCKA